MCISPILFNFTQSDFILQSQKMLKERLSYKRMCIISMLANNFLSIIDLEIKKASAKQIIHNKKHIFKLNRT